MIRSEIERQGPQSFAWFMEQALYHPEHGFYSSDRAGIGRAGDYFTNVSVGAVFGQLFTAQFAEIWERLGKPQDFVIVEQGAHHGDFARDVLEWSGQHYPEFLAALRYKIVEPFPRLQERQAQSLSRFGDRVQWCRSLEELQPFVGVHFSNELLDSFPVHLVVSSRDGWLEKMVGLNEDGFVFIEQPIADPKLKNAVGKIRPVSVGYQTEVNLAAIDWLEVLSKKLRRGCVLIVDYGFTREQFCDSQRSAGALQVRSQHRLLSCAFDEIGGADITSHIDWTSLAEWAEKDGLHVLGFTDQHHFLTGIISEIGDVPAGSKNKRALQTLLHPEMLGRAFHVLALEKDVTLDPLTGFKFVQDSRRFLGL